MMMRVLLADNIRLMLEGLRATLEKHGDFEIVGEADNGETAVRLARELLPDVVILEVSMPDLDGLRTTRRILADNPDVKVIGLAMRSDRESIKRMLEAGARGYLLKDCAGDELIRAIEAVRGGEMYISRKIADALVRDYLHQITKPGDPAGVELSHRELEVLRMIAEGGTTREIGARLNLSTKTIESHRRNVMAKLGMDSIAELTKYAIRSGIIPLEEPLRGTFEPGIIPPLHVTDQ